MNQKTVETTKECSECGESLPGTLKYFGSAPKNRDGLTGRCRECLRTQYRARYRKTRRACLAAQHRYKGKNQEKIRAAARENSRQWRKENPQKAKERGKQQYLRYKEEDPERLLAYSRRSYRKRGRWRALEKKYGISRTEFEKKAAEQQGRCLLCKKPPGAKGLVVDHSHETGVVRGLLCGKCNSVIGLVDEDVATLGRIIDYVQHHDGRA